MNRRSIRYEQDSDGRGWWIANGSYFRERADAYAYLDREYIMNNDIVNMYPHEMKRIKITKVTDHLRNRAPAHLFDMNK